MDEQLINSQAKFASKPQWRYFDMPGRIFKNDIKYDWYHSRLAYETNFYRVLLYTFLTHRKFLKFEFSYEARDTAPFIELHYYNSQIRYKFFRQLFGQDPQETTEHNIKKNAKRLTDFINNYFFEIINDLASVSRKSLFV